MSETLYDRRGIALTCRYWVTWCVQDIGGRRDLRCSFDSLTEALEHVAERTETGTLSGGVYDRRMRKWVQ